MREREREKKGIEGRERGDSSVGEGKNVRDGEKSWREGRGAKAVITMFCVRAPPSPLNEDSLRNNESEGVLAVSLLSLGPPKGAMVEDRGPVGSRRSLAPVDSLHLYVNLVLCRPQD